MASTTQPAEGPLHGTAHETSERIVVWPHRSLSRRGCTTLLCVVGALFLALAFSALASGAWPMAVYSVLALAGLAVAIFCNNRSARTFEIIELLPGNIRVSREDRTRVHHETSDFNPHWVQIVEAPGPWDDKRLLLRQRGRCVEIGAFLSAEERCELAAELRQRIALRYARG